MSAPRFIDYCAARFQTPHDALAEFFDSAVATASEAGASLDHLPLLDGCRHYLPNLSGRSDKKQFYVGSIEADKDGTAWPCVTFKSFKGNEKGTYWKPRDLAWQQFQDNRAGVEANDSARDEYRARIAAAEAAAKARKEERERTRAEGRKAAAAIALAAWVAAQPCDAHPYLARKLVASYGLRIAAQDHRARLWNDEDSEWQDVLAVRAGDLLVPAYDEAGNLANVQRIDASGVKRFVMGGRAHGCHFRIEGDSGRTALAEGYATGATWHEATGDAVVLAFSAGALPLVASYAAADIVAADNDESGAGETGAKATGLRYLMPPTLGDWNDYAEAHGLEGVRAAIASMASAARDEARREQQKAENVRLQQAAITATPPAMTVRQMESDCVWISEGSLVGFLSNPQHILSFSDFAGFTASNQTAIKDDKGREKPIANAILWRASQRRQTVFTRTFQAGAAPLCLSPDGNTALNSWRPIKRWPAKADARQFVEQVAYLFPDQIERDAFMDWLAHLEQRPGELPHYGWLHIAANTGTGRNWLASVLSRVWRGYVAPNVDLPALLDSQFNGQLAGRVLAIVDEVQEAAGENPYRHTNRLKSLVNAEYRDLNPKFGRQYREHNACRWLVFSNHDNALPLNDTDRRWRVVQHTAAPRSPADYAGLYALLADREFINAVGVLLAQRDIAGFNPGERPPMSDAKRAAVAASKTMIQQYAQHLVAHWPADLVTNADASELLSGGGERGFTPAMRRALEELGAVSISKPLKVRGQAQRCWIIRNHVRWAGADSAAQAREAGRARDGCSTNDPAVKVMARASETDNDTQPF